MGNGAVTPDVEGSPTPGMTADVGGVATTEGAPPSTSSASPTYQPPTATLEGAPIGTVPGDTTGTPGANRNFMEIPGWLGGPQGPLGQILGGMLGAPGNQMPPGAQVQQRHGGFITGLAGVLLEGLASGMAPTAQQASMMPILMDQARTQHAQAQLQQQQLQMEIADAPVRRALNLAQAQMYMLNSSQLTRELGIEGVIGPAHRMFAEKMLSAGYGHKEGEFPDYQSAMKATQELDARKAKTGPGSNMVYFQYPSTGDPNGPWTVWQAYPDKTLQEPFDSDMPPDQYGHPGQHIHVDAGQDLATAIKSAVEQAHGDIANRHAVTMNNVAAEIYADDMKHGRDPEMDPQFADAAQHSSIYAGQYKAAALAVSKAYTDYNQKQQAVDTTRESLKGARNGNEVMAALIPVQAILMTMGEGKVRRVNALELNRADPMMGDLVRRVDTIIERLSEGKLPEGYEKDINDLLNMYERSNLAAYRDSVDNYNVINRLHPPNNVPYGTQDLENEINALGGTYARGKFYNGTQQYQRGNQQVPMGQPPVPGQQAAPSPVQQSPNQQNPAQPAQQGVQTLGQAPPGQLGTAQQAPMGQVQPAAAAAAPAAPARTIPIQTPGEFARRPFNINDYVVKKP